MTQWVSFSLHGEYETKQRIGNTAVIRFQTQALVLAV